MREDPVEWLAGQWQEGVNLREEGRGLRTRNEADAWKKGPKNGLKYYETALRYEI